MEELNSQFANIHLNRKRKLPYNPYYFDDIKVLAKTKIKNYRGTHHTDILVFIHEKSGHIYIGYDC